MAKAKQLEPKVVIDGDFADSRSSDPAEPYAALWVPKAASSLGLWPSSAGSYH